MARDRIRTLDGVTFPTKCNRQSMKLRRSIAKRARKNYYNAVIEIGFEKSADELFEALQEIERALGREPNHKRNVSRTIDLDLLYCGSERAETTQCCNYHIPG